MSELQAVNGPRWRWHIGETTIYRYRRAHVHGGRLWGAERHGYGVDRFRTPIGALIGLRRWLAAASGRAADTGQEAR